MQTDKFTPRNVAKFVVTTAIIGKTAQVTENALVDYTALEEDSRTAEISGLVVGWLVSEKLKPVTDKMVDKTADFIVAQREKRAAKKNTEKE